MVTHRRHCNDLEAPDDTGVSSGYSGGTMRHPVDTVVSSAAGRLKYPTLLKLTAALFVITLIVPDPIPFVDEILLGLATLVLSRWRTRRDETPT